MLELSSEPGNLMNKNSFKYSGLANLETVDVADNTKGITFSRKNKKNAAQPSRNVVAVDLKKDFRKVAQTIKNKTEGANYRKDLSKPALLGGTRSGRARTRVPSARSKCVLT